MAAIPVEAAVSLQRNVRWTAISQICRVATQLLGNVVLARVLAPEDFGLMAMAIVMTTLAAILRDSGTGSAVIQRSSTSPQLLATVFWINVSIGLLMGVAMLIAAPYVAALFREPRLTPVVQWLAISLPISGLAIVQQALLQRQNRFRQLARIEIVSAISGVSVAILMALQGYGVYSLVGQSLAWALVSLVQLVLAVRFIPRHWVQVAELRQLLTFSASLTAFNLVNFISRYADNIVVGRFLGAAALGIYSIAYRLMMLPVQHMAWVANRALLPVLSRLQDDVAELARTYLQTITTIAAISAPAMALLMIHRDGVIELLFGRQWLAAAALLIWLAPVGFIQSITSTTGVLLTARGRTDVLLRAGIISAVLSVTAFLVGVRFGLIGVVVCYAIASAILTPYVLSLAAAQLGLRTMDLVRPCLPSVASSMIMALASLALEQALLPLGWPHWSQLMVRLATAALTYWLVMRWIFDFDVLNIGRKLLRR